MSDKQQVINEAWLWTDRTFWSITIMFLLGSMARTFVSNEPFDWKKFSGEMLFSLIGAVIMYSMGLMQGMTEVQIIFFGALSSLGGVRSMEWMIKIGRNIKKMESIGDE